MGGSYVVYDEVDPGYVDSGGASASDHGRKRRRRKFYNNLFDSVQDVLNEEAARVEALPEPPKPTVKRKKHLARQIVVAAGKADLLPVLTENAAVAIGTEAIEAVKAPDDTEKQFKAIAEMIAELQQLADEDEEDIEQLLLA